MTATNSKEKDKSHAMEPSTDSKPGNDQKGKDAPKSEQGQEAKDEQELIDFKWRLKLNSSDVFEKLMGDIEVKMREKYLRKLEAMKQAELEDEADAAASIEEEVDDEDDDDVEEEEEEQKEVISPSRAAALRAWNIIRRYIKDQTMKKNSKKSGINWNFLKQTLSTMTNIDKAREEMYNKYLNTDSSQWMSKLSVTPEQILKKAQTGKYAHLNAQREGLKSQQKGHNGSLTGRESPKKTISEPGRASPKKPFGIRRSTAVYT